MSIVPAFSKACFFSCWWCTKKSLLDSAQKTRDFRALNGMPLSQSFPFPAQRSGGKRRKKDCKSWRCWVTASPREHTGSVTACRRTTQVQIKHNPSSEESECMRSPTPSLETICNGCLLGKEKISFLQWRITGYIDHTLSQASCPGVVGLPFLSSPPPPFSVLGCMCLYVYVCVCVYMYVCDSLYFCLNVLIFSFKISPPVLWGF